MTIDHDSEAFALLAEQERTAKERRIRDAIPHGGTLQILTSDGLIMRLPNQESIQIRQAIASLLYESFYSFKDEPTDTQFLETFCWTVFGCSSREVIQAWDKELG